MKSFCLSILCSVTLGYVSRDHHDHLKRIVKHDLVPDIKMNAENIQHVEETGKADNNIIVDHFSKSLKHSEQHFEKTVSDLSDAVGSHFDSAALNSQTNLRKVENASRVSLESFAAKLESSLNGLTAKLNERLAAMEEALATSVGVCAKEPATDILYF